ncbi:hypothetical protein NGRA_0705 [Nosema granulosis]|uniref:B-block binding subunit of TFIIIC domain-containing protein n=1 Tax=Nosema granulosis TaxID=83296 RepID=A0A9P6L0A3_9MICR|nr:hypothetical protein NGRA_0705 [Nosema granulosis]
MDDLKKKIFKFGMYGKPINSLSNEELELLRNCNWVQFFYKEDLEQIQADIDYCPTTKVDFSNPQNIYARMVFSYFKRIVSKTKFKEISSFRIMNHLIVNEEFIKQTDLMQIGNVSAKKVSYILRTLRKYNLVDKKLIKNASYVKMNLDGLFETFKKSNDPPKIPTAYSREVPIFIAIKNRLFASETGLISEDIKNAFGFGIKRSHMFLKSLASKYPDSIFVKNVFEGRSRKHLFVRKEGAVNESLIKDKGLVTVDDRVRALRSLIRDKKWLTMCDKTCSQFRDILGIKHTPDRKTLIATAIKADLRVFNIKGIHPTTSYIIANKETSLMDIFSKREKPTKKDNEYAKKIHSKYVKYVNFLVLDNLYEDKLPKRAEIVCQMIFNAYGLNPCILSDDFLLDQTFDFMLKIVPFYKVNFVRKLEEELNACNISTLKKETNTSILQVLTIKDVLSSPIDDFSKREINEKIKTKTILKNLMEPIWLDCMKLYIRRDEYLEIINELKGTMNLEDTIVYDSKIYINYSPAHKTDLGVLLRSNSGDIVLKLTEDFNDNIQKRRKLDKSTFYVPYEDRLKLYQSACSVTSKQEFENLVVRYIQTNKYVARQELIRFFKEKFGIIVEELTNEQNKEYLFTKIKHDLYTKEKTDTIEYNEYSHGQCQEVLNELHKTKYIKSTHRDLTLENIQLREEIKKRLDRKISLPISNLDSYVERDTVYNIYFNIIFDLLVISGTLEIGDLLAKANVLEHFELICFLKVYKDVFEMEDIDGCCLVSLKLNIDPFEIE